MYVCKQILYKQKCKYENLLKYLSAMLMCLDYFRLRVFFSHTFAFFLGVRDENTRQIDCFTAHFVASPQPSKRGGEECLACCSLTNLFQHINIYDNVLHRR